MQALVIKKIGDRITEEIFPEAKPQPATVEDERDSSPQSVAEDGPPEELALHDSRGRLLGTARLVPGVAVYVLGDGYGTVQAELSQCLLQEGGEQYQVTGERGRVTGIVYLPDPNRPKRTHQALRADDV